MKTYNRDPFYRPTRKQLDYAGALAREIRDRLQAKDGAAPSAHELSKYFTIEDLKDMLKEVRAGNPVEIA